MPKKWNFYLVIAGLVLYAAFLLHRINAELAGNAPVPASTPVDTGPAPTTLPEPASTSPTTQPIHRLNWSAKNIQRLSKGPEAGEWLRLNPNPDGFASGRFGSTKQANRFVQMLYAAGAKNVIIPNEAIDRDEQGPYADAMVVFLPEDSLRKNALRAICNQEIIRSHGDPKDQETQDAMLLWWE